LGNGTTTQSATPVEPVGLSGGVVAVAAGWEHTCALTTAGGVKCWGFNNDGRLGTGTGEQSLVPVDVVGLSSGVTAISASRYNTCALTSTGGVMCWGYNEHGELGNEPERVPVSAAPVLVSGLDSGVRAISTGMGHSCALTTGGGVVCRGANFAGQLGDGTTNDAHAPVKVTPGLGPA